MAKSVHPTEKSVKIDKEGLVTINWSHSMDMLNSEEITIADIEVEFDEDMNLLIPMANMVDAKNPGKTIEVGLVEHMRGLPFEAFTITIGDPVDDFDWARR